MRIKLLLFAFLCSVFSWGQAVLPVTRTAWNAGPPLGWTDGNATTPSYTTPTACNTTAGRLDNSTEFYQVFFDSAPDQLTYSIRLTGAAITSSLLVQQSIDGVTWSNIINHTGISGTTCTVFNSALLSTTRYVKWTYTKVAQNLVIDDVNITKLPVTDAVDYCNLQSPANGTITQGGAFNVYAQAYEPGVTEAAGIGTGVAGWIGYSSANTDPSTGGWTWVPASFNVQVGNNDELVADIGTALAPGTYYYASRFQLNGGPYRYGGYNTGFWNGTTNVNGVLTVNPSVVDYCNLQFPATQTITEGSAFNVYAKVYEPGVTPPAGAPIGIQGWIGYSTTNVDPSTGVWTWVPATFNAQVLNDDEFVTSIGTGLAAGTYYYASRFQLGVGAYRYGGYNAGFWDGTTNINGVLTVQGPEINIQGNAVSIADNDVTPVTTDDTDFGSVTLGGNITKTFTIQNTGNANLNLTAASPYVVISGTNASDFSITTIPSNPIAGASSTTFVVTFNPATVGIKNATLTINNNDLNEGVYNFDIRGNCNPVGGVNDLCTAATPLVINAAPIAGTLTGSTFTAPFTKKDVWYSFTPTCSGTHNMIISGFTGDVDIELFSGACPATITPLDSSAGTTSTETITLALTAGTTYYLRVLAFNVAAETANFSASVTSSSELQLTNTGSPATGNVTMGTTNVVIMGFATTPNCTTSYSISNVTLGSAVVATATTADVSNFRIGQRSNDYSISTRSDSCFQKAKCRILSKRK